VKSERLEFLADNPHYTKRFAFYVGRRCRSTPIRDIAAELKLDWHSVKELDKQYMRAQLEKAGTPTPMAIGIDEISVGEGHDYRIVVSDLVRRRAIWFGGTDRSEASMSQFYQWLGERKCARIRLAVMDMWKPFRNATNTSAPQAAILFDKFHVIRHLGEALDKIRKSEYARLSGKDRGFIKGQKYTLLSRRENLTLEGRQALRTLLRGRLRSLTVFLSNAFPVSRCTIPGSSTANLMSAARRPQPERSLRGPRCLCVRCGGERRGKARTDESIDLQSANDMQDSGADTQVFHKSLIGLNLINSIIAVLDAKQIGRVNGDKHAAVALTLQDFAANLGDRDGPSQHPTGGCGAERYDQIRIDDRTLLFEPPAAALDLVSVGALMEATLSALFELEVFDRVGDEDFDAIKPRICDRPIKHTASRPDKGTTLQIFVISRLFPHEHDLGVVPTFSGDHLGRILIERAARAARLGSAEFIQARSWLNQVPH
jgi:hypothetical protein